MNIIFFDTETTGNTEKDYLCQIAYKSEGEEFSGLYKPPIKIPPEASAVHHISNKMVASAHVFRESPEYKKIKNLFENSENVSIAHNALFDIAILKNEDINVKNFICTLRVARRLDPEGKIEQYKLQYLRYLLDLDVDATAHDALGDVLVLEKLFERLKNKIMTENNIDEEKALAQMLEISSHPSLFKKINFGKYNGQTIEDIARIDRGYLEWLLKQKLEGDQIDEDWIYTLQQVLGK